jgi:putative PIN family toxin of toxin-antitoxin system
MSGLFWRGTPSLVLEAWRDGRFGLVISPEVFAEYERVGDELRAARPGVDPHPFLRLVLAAAVIVDAGKLQERVCSDPDDDKFIACALAGAADFLVSGDKALLAVSGHRGLRVLTPRRFLGELGGR